jgi:hypothetical protein
MAEIEVKNAVGQFQFLKSSKGKINQIDGENA